MLPRKEVMNMATKFDQLNGDGEALFEQCILEYIAARDRHVRHPDPETQKFLDYWIQEEKPDLERYATEHGLRFDEEFSRITSAFHG